MNDCDDATAMALARIGISITRHESPDGWGWAMQNAKMIRDWDGPYATPTAAIEAALAWLLEHARKGLLCRHTHPPTPEATVPVENNSFVQTDWYTLN